MDTEATPSTDQPLQLVVGIGASAGGLAALEAFLAGVPAERPTGAAFVVVQHLAPELPSALPEILQAHTTLRVAAAADGQALAADTVHVIPPGVDPSCEGDVLRLRPHPAAAGPRLTVNHFFRSLADAWRERAVAVVLSGSGSDGAAGVRAVKSEGGLVLAQAPDSAEHDSMPRAVIDTGQVDFVLRPEAMAERLLAYARHLGHGADHAAGKSRDGVLKKLAALLLAQTGHDFSQYKETTLLRRMERRMALHQIAGADDYVRYAREHPAEVEALFRDLLIGVTSFFRDAEAFKALQEHVVPRLVQARAARGVLRLWVCGCSTGEEAYSIAIVFQEHILATHSAIKLQVFATDIDRHAIETARAGVFPASIAAEVTPERLVRWFGHDAQRGTYRVQKSLRDLLIFSEQNVLKDPPFSRLDLVSCRNLMIYLMPEAQRRLVPLFHYALQPGGALFLGTSETVGDHSRLFTAVDRKWKLYLRLAPESEGARPAIPEFVPPGPPPAAGRRAARAAGAGDEPGSLRQITEQALLTHYAQAGLLINEQGQILHIFGRSGRFLEPADGDASMNLLSMAREGLRRELMVALHKAVATRQPVAFNGLQVRSNGHWISANLVVRPADADAGGAALYLVVLEEAPPLEPGAAGALPDAEDHRDDRITQLECELRAKDEYLQTTLEEMETTNEELKSTNEEMQSVNEELQSTNEELETSKEELQSVNEELSTVNAELHDRVADLSRANNDMNNLLAGTGVGTVFVDHELRIARFTPAATQVINLIPTDIGRPLAHVVSNVINDDRMLDDIRAVLDSLVPREAEVQIRSGAWYLMRIRPYRTMENLIEGAVVTLVDISERKKAEQALMMSGARLNAFIQQAYAGVAEVTPDGRLAFVNDRLCQMLGYTRDELLQRRLRDITDPRDFPALQAQLDAVAQGGPEARCDRHYVRNDGGRLPTQDRISAIRGPDGGLVSLLVLSFDVSPG